MRNNSTFTNSATLTIGAVAAVGGTGLLNLLKFSNAGCGALLNIVADAVISNSFSFSNTGTIIENASGNSNISSNTGLVQNLNGGTFTIGSGNAAITTPGLVWTGCTSTDWNTPTNWSLGRVPLATDDVVLVTATNAPLLSTTAVANSVEVQSGASLSITSAGSLTINGSKSIVNSGSSAFYNFGTVNNSGQVVIGNSPTASVGQYGLVNQATFSNQPGGRIQIDRSTAVGLNNVSGSFTNAATVTIGANAAVGQSGLYNSGTFSNQTGGVIQIDRSTNTGLVNSSGSFTNSATVTIGANAAVGQSGLYNGGTFSNQTGGVIQIDRSTNTGLVNGTGSFTNSATLTIGANAPVGNYGLYNLATFRNQPGGRIQIDRSTGTGLNNVSGSFTNSATLTIGANAAVGSVGLLNTATFSNAGCGALLTIAADAVIIDGSSFSNTGTIIENASGTSNISYNAGLVQNRNGGTFSITNNAGILVKPLAGCTTIGISPALQIGTSSTLSVGTTWYADAALTTAVGTYSPNSLTLTGGTAGLNRVYFAVTDAANSCTTVASVDVSLSLAVGITAQPVAGSSVCVGGSVTASVSATGTGATSGGPLTYQWYKGGAVAGQTSATLSLTNVQPSNAGSYSVVVTGACNSVTSTAFSLTVNAPPSVSNPATTTATAGSPFSQTFTASGGSGAYSFSLASGSLPTGLSLATTGVLSGTPTQSGSFSITVQATDANGCSGVGATYPLVVSPAVVIQPIRYVKQGGSGTGDGTSWADASADLQSQINAPGVQQVWVAAGIYKPTTGSDQGASFAMKNGVAIYGGFPTTGNPTFADRGAVNPITGSPSSSTLSGDIGTVGDNSDNSYHVISNGSLNNTAVLDGFVITGGNANGSFPNNSGGAMYNNGSSGRTSSPTLTNCSFQANSATLQGGAMYNAGGGGTSSPTLTNCAFQANSATQQGGAMYNEGNSGGTSIPTLTNCSFLNN